MSELTKKALAESVISLLEKKSLDKITIKEITDTCGLTRNTFYYHFQDVYDLLGWMFIRQADEMIKRFNEEKDWEKVFLEGIEYLYDNRKVINSVYKSINRSDLEKYLHKVVGIYALKLIDIRAKGLDISKKSEKITAVFFENAFVGVIIQWIESDMKTSPEELAILCNGMFKGTVEGALYSAEKMIQQNR